MPSSRPIRALAEGDRVLVQLPGRPVSELTPAEAAALARQLLALGPVRDHEALEVARVLAEDVEQGEFPAGEELAPSSDPELDALARAIAEQQARDRWGDG